jgi:multiple sugar transport system ATP-binding protein
VIEGEVKKGKITLSNGTVIGETKVKDGLYDLGLRPEDFKADENGFDVDTTDIDHTGRDTMIRFMIGEKQLRALVDSESVEGKKTIKLAVKKNKIHIFDQETGNILS